MHARLRQTTLAAAVAVLVLVSAAPAAASDTFGTARLVQFAQLSAQTFVSASEDSGGLLGGTPSNGVVPPFADQPVQGFSGIIANRDGTFDVMSDNGYGAKNNSADFVLRIHRLAPDFDHGGIDVVGGINLTDPNHVVPFPLTRADRVLTGADFDIESMVRANDGTYWIGDEFGPYLLHADRAGRLLQAPVQLPGVFSPDNPERGSTPPNLAGSKGFEGMSRSPSGRTLYPMLEGPVAGDPADQLRINEFSLASASFTGRRFAYRLADPGNAIGDTTMVDENRMLVIERDGLQGDAAAFKRIFMVDLRDRDHDGLVDKTLVADLLDIANPNGVGGFGPVFRFPFTTIEDVVILDDHTIGVLNDNNFPFSSGRTPGQPDNDEFIVLRLTDSLHVDHRIA
jgi:hypothetical protein